MATVTKKSVVSYYLVAGLWFLWAFFGSLYRVSDFVLLAVLSVIVFALGKVIWPDKKWVTPEEKVEKDEPKEEEKTESTGNPELDALLAERDKAVGEMHRLNDAIKDEKISAQIDRLEATTQKIIKQVVENPTKLPQIRKFMNYYLPTTLKLLNAYDRMGDQGVAGENITGTMKRVEDMMDTIVRAFEKQLDSLFGAEALDISTDITVLDNMMAREGLVEDMIHRTASKETFSLDEEDGGITLEL